MCQQMGQEGEETTPEGTKTLPGPLSQRKAGCYPLGPVLGSCSIPAPPFHEYTLSYPHKKWQLILASCTALITKCRSDCAFLITFHGSLPILSSLLYDMYQFAPPL